MRVMLGALATLATMGAAYWLAGYPWGLVLGVILVVSLGLLIASSGLGIFHLRGGEYLIWPVVALCLIDIGYQWYEHRPAIIERKAEEAREQKQAAVYATTIAQQAPPSAVEGLVLMRDCLTPCTVPISYPFKVMRINPLKIKWAGLSDWMEYPSEWDLKAPAEMRSGETMFDSADEKKPQVRIKVYKKTTVLGGR